MKYVIYEPASRGRARQRVITNDAIDANFLAVGEKYELAIQHPTEDKSALPVLNIESIYYQGLPTKGYDFEIFFTLQEMARAVDSLTIDWVQNNTAI